MALFGLTRLGLSPPASDFVSLNTFSLLQGCAHFNLFSLVNEEVHTKLPMSSRSLAHIGVSAVVLSASTTDSLLVCQSLAHCELFNLAKFSLPTTTRSMACASTFLSAFICARSDTLPSVRSFAKVGSSLFAFGSPLLVRGAPRSRSRLFFIAEEVFLGLSSLLHSHPHLSAFVLVTIP